MGEALPIQPSPAIAPRPGLAEPVGRSSTGRLADEVAHGPLLGDPATMPVIIVSSLSTRSAWHPRLGATRPGHISPAATVGDLPRD